MPIINQTASITGISTNVGLFVWMLIAGGIIIFIVWAATQLKKSG
jgi:hypothetical protein